MGLFLNIFLRGALFSRRPMHGATTIGAFGEDVAWHVALVSPFPPAPSLLATWRWRRQHQWRLEHGASQTGDLRVGAAFQLWQGEQQLFSCDRESSSREKRNYRWREYRKRQQLWRFRVFKYTICFIIFFSCFPFQLGFAFVFVALEISVVSNIFCKLFCYVGIKIQFEVFLKIKLN